MTKFEISVDIIVEAHDEGYANEIVEALINEDGILEINRQKTKEVESYDPDEEPEYTRELDAE